MRLIIQPNLCNKSLKAADHTCAWKDYVYQGNSYFKK